MASRAWSPAQIDFNLSSYVVVDGVPAGVVNGGRVTYASFHNEADMDQLLEQMLLGL